MSQPAITATIDTQAALEELKQAGAPVEKAPRPYLSKRMNGLNAEIYSQWIERWANNAASNYPIVKRSEGVAFLRNCAKDVPAVVVGIGPSLDDEIKALTIAPRHAVIIATDAALRPLLRHGIRPDIVVNYDARDHQSSMWNTIDTSGLVLLANSVTSPLTVQAWKGKVMFFNMMQADDEFASNILPALFPFTGQLPNIGTVGNGAVFLAWQMGCKPILGVGMDLCYRQVNSPATANVPTNDQAWRYRCQDWELGSQSGNWFETENKVLYDNDVRLKNASDEVIKGKTYKTDDMLRFYRNGLVSKIGGLDIPFINCSGGALTDLVKTMNLKDAIEQKCYQALDPGRTIAKHLFPIIPDGKRGWAFDDDNKIFIPNTAEALAAPRP